MEGAGFEPAKPFRTPDLQSGGFNHSPTPPGMGIFAYLPVPVQSRVFVWAPLDLARASPYLTPLGIALAGLKFKSPRGDSNP